VKSAKRPRESDAKEQEPVAGEKVSKKKAKKLKAENGAALPAPAEIAPDAQKKGEKKDKKGKKGAESKESEAKTEEGVAKQKQGDKDNLRELPSGLKIQDAKIGDGPHAKKGMNVSMRYIGKLPDGKVFDSNTKGKPVRRPALPVLTKNSCDRPSSQFTFRLGVGEVIKGL
jgi:FK506-binding nuclear protein